MKIPRMPLMKLSAAAILLALVFVLAPKCRAQDDDDTAPVKVKITRYPDNSYSAMKTDLANHEAENSKYDAAGKLTETTYFSLDENGRALYGWVFAPKGAEPKGTLKYKTAYKYDAMSRLIEVSYYTANDQFKNREVYSYDSAGKVAKKEIYDAAGKLTATAYAGEK